MKMNRYLYIWGAKYYFGEQERTFLTRRSRVKKSFEMTKDFRTRNANIFSTTKIIKPYNHTFFNKIIFKISTFS